MASGFMTYIGYDVTYTRYPQDDLLGEQARGGTPAYTLSTSHAYLLFVKVRDIPKISVRHAKTRRVSYLYTLGTASLNAKGISSIQRQIPA